MRKSKLILLLALVLMSVLLVAVLSSCGEDGPTDTTAPPKHTTAPAVTTSTVVTTTTPVYKATFVYDDPTTEAEEKIIVGVVSFQKGDKELSSIPEVPAVDGYLCQWGRYMLTTAKGDITVYAEFFSLSEATDNIAYEKITDDKGTSDKKDDVSYYVVTRLTKNTDHYVIIPATYQGKDDKEALPVLGIAANAFDGNETLLGVYIADGVTEIGDHAFAGCTSLATVVLPSDLETLGSYAFYGTAITEITIPGTLDAIGEQAFGACTSLTAVTLSEGIRTIGKGAFASCTSLTEITVPSTVTSVGSLAFYCNTAMTSAVLPGSVATLDVSAFYGCSSLTNVTASVGALAGIPKESLQTLVITEGKSQQLTYALLSGCYNLTSISLPASLVSIQSAAGSTPGAFSDCKSLTTVTVADANTVFSVNEDGCLVKIVQADPDKNIEASVTLVLVPAAKAGALSLAGITEVSAYAMYGCAALTSVDFADVKTIGSSALAGCTGLTSVTLPAGATLGDDVFADCTGLTSVTLPADCRVGTGVFSGCTGVTSATLSADALSSLPKKQLRQVVINAGETIAKRAFYNCDQLESIVIGDTVTTIGANAFWGCTGVVAVEGGVSYVGKWVVDCDSSVTSVTLRADTVGIASGAFDGCSGLTALAIPATVRRVNVNAFSDCTALIKVENGVSYVDKWAIDCDPTLESVTLKADTVGIAAGAFENCTALKTLVIPTSVEKIDKYILLGCSSLESITLPYIGAMKDGSGDTSFGYLFGAAGYTENATYVPTTLTTVVITGDASVADNAFRGCSRIVSVTLTGSVTAIGDGAFQGCVGLVNLTLDNSLLTIGEAAFKGCTKLTTVALPNSVIAIGDSAFEGCVGLADLTLGNGLLTIGEAAFKGCTKLTTVTLPDLVTMIGANAFQGCTGLVNLTLGNGLLTIGDSAFKGCSKVATVVIPDSVAMIGGNAFQGCTAATLFCEAAEKPAGWIEGWNGNVAEEKIYFAEGWSIVEGVPTPNVSEPAPEEE